MLLKMEKDVNACLRGSQGALTFVNIFGRERILAGEKNKEMQQRACARTKLW
jgi:hypothetical protein